MAIVKFTSPLSINPGNVLRSGGNTTYVFEAPLIAGRYQIFEGFRPGEIIFKPQAVGEVFPEWWGAKNNGDRPDAVDCTEALKCAASAAGGIYGIAVSLLPGSYTTDYYKINSLAEIDQNTVKFKGTAHRSVIKAGSAAAGIKFSKGGSDAIYSPVMENVIFHGAGVSTVGLDFDRAEEAQLINAGAIDCVTGIRLKGTGGPTNLRMISPVCSNNGTAFDLVNAGDVQIFNPDCYDNDKVFDFTTCWRLFLSGGWIEDFDYVFNFDHSAKNAICYSLMAQGGYYLNTRGGGSYTSRIFRSYANSNTYQTYLPMGVFRDNHLYLTASKYIAEVAWGSPHSYGPFDLKMADNHLMVGTNTTAWMTSDVLDNPSIVIRLDNNQHADVTGVIPSDVLLPYISINGKGCIPNAGYFKQVGDLTTDGATHELDFGNVVPFGARRVTLLVSVQDDVAGSYILFSKNGASAWSGICRTQGANIVADFDVEVELDINRKAQYQTTNTTFTVINITVKSWM